MRGLWNGERQGSFGVVLGLFALACMFVLLAGGLLWQTHQFGKFRDVVIERCEIRLRYDMASQDARRAIRGEMVARRAAEKTNRFVDAEMRASRVAALDVAIAQLDVALMNGAPGACRQYGAEGLR